MSEASLAGSKVRRLKSLGQKLDPMVHVGKSGLTEAVLGNVAQALSRHELIKVRFEAHKEEKKSLAPELAARSGSQVVQRVGNVVVLYREHPEPEKRKILFPPSGPVR